MYPQYLPSSTSEATDPATMGTVVDVVLFDLDGTISDSAPGILGALRAAFAEMGLAPLGPAAEQALLGPPFRDTLPPHVGADRVEEAVERYRRHYATEGGMFDTRLYDGIADLLSDLHGRGVRLGLATSKPDAYAPTILEHLGVRSYFEVVCGDDLAGSRGTKTEVVAEALHRLGRPDPSSVRMVGDRSYDVIGAGAHGVSTLGAGWGYGAPGELLDTGAIAVFTHPDELGRYLGVGRD